MVAGRLKKFFGEAIRRILGGNLRKNAADQAQNTFINRLKSIILDNIQGLARNVSKKLLNNQTKELVLGQVVTCKYNFKKA